MKALAALLLAAAPLRAEPLQLLFDGQVRVRYEGTDLSSYAGARSSADQLLLRTRLGVKAEPADGLVGYLQLQDSRISGQEASVAANSGLTDLHQGWLELQDPWGLPLEIRAGRMELSYGDQRLISPLDWSNAGRAWDGVRLRTGGSSWTADLFTAVVKESSSLGKDDLFSGLYASCRAVEGHEFDAYVLHRHFGDNSFTSEAGGKGNLDRRTLGARAKGSLGGVSWTAELAHQSGRRAGDRIGALGAAATAGRSFGGTLKPWLGLGYTYASGDSGPADGRLGTFTPEFPFAHAYQGYADVNAWQNGHDAFLSGRVEPAKDWKLQADYHVFRLADPTDAWYAASGAVQARDAAGASGTEVGTELDLHLKGRVRDALSLWLGCSRFFAGDFVAKTAGGREKQFWFLQAVLDFGGGA